MSRDNDRNFGSGFGGLRGAFNNPSAPSGPQNAASGSPSAASGPSSNDKFARITGKLGNLRENSQRRGQRLQNVKRLFEAIIVLNTEIREAMREARRGEESSVSPAQLTQIEEALARLEEQLGNTDRENDELIRALLQNANDLIAIREGLPGTSRSGTPGYAATPAVSGVRTAMEAVTPSRGNEGASGMRAGRMKGGYKHSKTNSRKYMVKRFRSLRGSLKRDKKRKRKTLRRRSARK
jgi:hypothetical protein